MVRVRVAYGSIDNLAEHVRMFKAPGVTPTTISWHGGKLPPEVRAGDLGSPGHPQRGKQFEGWFALLQNQIGAGEMPSG